jgi:hypothetical protein
MSNNIEFEAPITVESEIKKDKKDKGLKNDIGSAVTLPLLPDLLILLILFTHRYR